MSSEHAEKPASEDADLKRIIADFGSIQEWKKYSRDSIKDTFDAEFKSNVYLITGNSAGFVGCLSFIKDYDPTKSQLHGLGFITSIFSCGFISSVLAMIMCFVLFENMKIAFEERNDISQPILLIYRCLQGMSIIAMFLAVIIITIKVSCI